MLWTAVGVWYLFASIVTFGVYGYDKHRAKVAGWRVRERTLHLLDLAGGWPGGFIGQQVFRHKRRRAKYQIVFWTTAAAHLAVWAIIAVHGRRQ